jgi:TolB protein
MIVFASTRFYPSVEACPTGIDLRCPTDIYVMNADGSGITRLTTDPAAEWNPVWSPDGTQIAFVKGESEVEVFVMKADGSGVQQVTATEGGSGFAPSWSPDGTKIAFGSIQYEDWGIFAVNADGTNERPLLFDNSIYATNPVWSPDGNLIVFTGSVGSADHTGLYVIRPDGSAVTRISSGATGGFTGGVAWQPLPG